MATEVPQLKKLLADNLTTVPDYGRVRHNSQRVVGPTSVISKKELPYFLGLSTKAPILEAEFVNALETFPEPEYLWVYYEGVDRVFEILKCKPQPMLAEDEVFVMNYLQSVERDILKLAEMHMFPHIYARVNTTQTAGDIRRFFEKYQPSDKNWEGYVYLAEHCHNESPEKFLTTPFRAHVAVQYFMCLLAYGYDAERIIKGLSKCLKHDMLEFPTQDCSTQKVRQFLDSLRLNLQLQW